MPRAAMSITRQGGYYDVEDMIAARPDILASGDEYRDTPSLRTDQNDHPCC
jgi:hypothetical protein